MPAGPRANGHDDDTLLATTMPVLDALRRRLADAPDLSVGLQSGRALADRTGVGVGPKSDPPPDQSSTLPRSPMSAHPEALMPSTALPTAPPAPVSLLEAFLYWLKLGFVSFGGPAGQIAMMHTDLVERRRWISEHRLLHALNRTMVLPGPEAQQLAT